MRAPSLCSFHSLGVSFSRFFLLRRDFTMVHISALHFPRVHELSYRAEYRKYLLLPSALDPGFASLFACLVIAPLPPPQWPAQPNPSCSWSKHREHMAGCTIALEFLPDPDFHNRSAHAGTTDDEISKPRQDPANRQCNKLLRRHHSPQTYHLGRVTEQVITRNAKCSR